MHDKENSWDKVISPSRKLFNLNLKEVWQYRDLIAIFARRDVVTFYKQTVLGPLWLFIAPIFTVITFTFVFNNIAGISTDGIPAPIFYLGGLVLWNYFQNCLTSISSVFISNSNIFGKVYFPRLVSPISLAISNLFKFSIQFVLFLLLLGFYILFDDQSNLNISLLVLFIPLIVLITGSIAIGSGIIISSLTTKYRDLSYLLSFGVSLLMYATPVIYPVSSIPSQYLKILRWNPIAPLIEFFRYAFTGYGTFEPSNLIYSILFAIIVLTLGVITFNKVEKNFMDTV